MAAYYNENDPKAAAWLRELIKQGAIADGEVDERSIEDVTGTDLARFTQCHFFAGIGGWAYALDLAGWGDKPVWTGSCPCQPFSDAGQKGGTADKRHLWPHFFRLIGECRPATVFGEQVASKDGLAWLDIVSADLESADYAVGAADLCAAGVEAPHLRQRLWFVAHSNGADASAERQQHGRQQRLESEDGGAMQLADSSSAGLAGRSLESARQEQPAIERSGDAGELALAEVEQHDGCRDPWLGRGESTDGSHVLGLADARSERRQRHAEAERRIEEDSTERREDISDTKSRGIYDNFEWIECIDGKWRPVEPGTFPLAHGVPARMGRLRGYGNAIVPQVAAEFVMAYQGAVSAKEVKP